MGYQDFDQELHSQSMIREDINFKQVENTREFDSSIFKKSIAGLVKPAFFMSNFLFLGIAIYGNVWYNIIIRRYCL